MEPYISPIVGGLYEKRKAYSEVAEIDRLERHKYISMIGTYAERFGKDPDDVFKFSSFGTVTKFLIEAKDRSEYHDRYSQHEKNMTTLPK